MSINQRKRLPFNHWQNLSHKAYINSAQSSGHDPQAGSGNKDLDHVAQRLAAIPNFVLPKGKITNWKSLEDLIMAAHQTDLNKRPTLNISVEPKVLLPYNPRPNETPRRLEMERRRNLFQKQNLIELVQKEGISFHDDKITIQQPGTGDHQLTVPVKLLDTLQTFDNTDFEERSLDTWISVGSLGETSKEDEKVVSVLLPCKAFVGSEWVEGHVTSVNKETQLFTFKDLAMKDHELPRVRVAFAAEDPFNFAKRFSFAVLHSAAINHADHHQSGKEQDDWLMRRMQDLHPAVSVKKGNDALNIPGRNKFEDVRQAIKKRILYQDDRIYKMIMEFRAVLTEAENQCKISIQEKASVDPETWLKNILSIVLKCDSYIKKDWLSKCHKTLLQTLGNMGKGWYNIQENQFEVYRLSRTSCLMFLIRFFMQDTFTDIVLDYLKHLNETVYLALEQDKRAKLYTLVVLMKEDTRTIAYSSQADVMINYFRNFLNEFLNVFDRVPQLEQIIMNKLVWADRPNLDFIRASDSRVLHTQSTIQSGVNQMFAVLGKDQMFLEKFQERIFTTPQEFREKYQDRVVTMPIEEIEAEIVKLQNEEASILKSIPLQLECGFITVDLSEFRKAVMKAWDRALIDIVVDNVIKVAMKSMEEITGLTERIKFEPQTIEEISMLRQFLSTIPLEHQKFMSRLQDIDRVFKMMERFSIKAPSHVRDIRNRFNAEIKSLADKAEDKADSLKAGEKNLLKALQGDIEGFTERLTQLKNIVTNFKRQADINLVNDLALEAKNIGVEAEECVKNAALINSREKLFNLPVTDYGEVVQVVKDFEIYRNSWEMAKVWRDSQVKLRHGDFKKIDSSAVEKMIADTQKLIAKGCKLFVDNKPYLVMVNIIKKEMEEFTPSLNVILSLRNPALRERHWLQLTEQTKITLSPTSIDAFDDMAALNILNFVEPIQKISDTASKEYGIESALDSMQAAWKDIIMDTVPYRETGTHACKISEDVTRLLDDHITMTQSMAFSPFKKPFQDRINSWDQSLRTVQDLIEVLLECQKMWMYLEPIFSSDDIVQQLPQESRKFSLLSKTWKRTMTSASSKPKMLEFCDNRKLLTTLNEALRAFEQISKSLSSYLDSKRLAFPRFFFLSDDELLQILSQTKNPTSVQPHLRKCFENIQQLVFESDRVMKAMVSADGEVVPFAENVIAQGNVEAWLKDVEVMMRKSIKSILSEAIIDYVKKPRTKWVRDWPGQIVIAASQTHWTQQVEDAFRNKSDGGMASLAAKLSNQLQDLVALVREDLPKILRSILSDLIIIDVHARDVVQNLADSNVESSEDYEWSSQLRYYWNDQENELYVKIMNNAFKYGAEYIGNNGRLVITPLTDRCYLTLCLAMGLNMGGAPQGPAGTGKTETTKDLAKAMAKQCVVFNCSDGLDYLSMAKFFRGLASAGAWACFDEFNRIDIEVLSVIAQQVATIQRAVAANVSTFIFEGTNLSLDASCAIFITMNPGYAGRSELPDNLKALFRPVAMMIPSYRIISEISLFSFGFAEARDLSEKIVATFRLSSELLSSQDHYDFGMRAVKSVISSAGALKRQYTTEDESFLILRSLSDCNLPKFLANDIPLFEGILKDLFPKTKKPVSSYPYLDNALIEACKQLGFQPTEYFMSKCIQLYETTRVRHGLMLVGPTGGGKTSCYRTLAKALSSLNGKNVTKDETYLNVRMEVLNPKSITSGQLYGEFDLQTHEWTDGIVPSLVREGVADNSGDAFWYVFDGPVDAMWIESMNTVLDDNKKLCLTSGEIIKLLPTQKMVFEVDNLAHASPATVSRCGMVFMEPEALGMMPLFNSWRDKFKQQWASFTGCDSFFNNLMQLLGARLPEIIKEIRLKTKETYATTNAMAIKSFLAILEANIKNYIRLDGSSTDLGAVNVPDLLLFSLMWSVGATVDASSKKAVSEILRSYFEITLDKTLDPNDYYFDSKSGRWETWSSLLDGKSASNIRFDYVPTFETCRYEYLLRLLNLSEKHVLFVGGTGTGKTSIIAEYLKMLPDTYLTMTVNFSAKSNANQTQDLIDSKVTKRRKGVFGPPLGQKMNIFVDDLNLPAAESTGTQPSIELLRQFMDHSGWYDRQQVGKFIELQDIAFICAMSPSGGGKPVTSRFQRHFSIFYLDDFEDVSLKKIYNTIFDGILNAGKIPFTEIAAPLVEASIGIYKTVRKSLLPTPLKSHYMFNLRDLSKVFKGMRLASGSSITSSLDLLRLWVHENYRVFHDRLVDDADRSWFTKLIKEQVEQEHKVAWESVKDTEMLLFGSSSVAESTSYTQIKDLKKLTKFADDCLDEFNNAKNSALKLVFFPDALDHLVRIARIIRQPEGHALLLGVGGSGKQSLTKIACFMLSLPIFQIEVAKNYGFNEWREDLKKIFLQTGVDGQSLVFLFSDTQLISESCLEDINSILNSGMVPSIFKSDEIERILQSMRTIANNSNILIKSKEQLFTMFTQRIKQNLRCVVCMSPGSEQFRTRVRMFPALINCCTLNWFPTWSPSALSSVANQSLGESAKLDNDAQLENVVNMCVFMHEQIREISNVFKAQTGRINHVTPKSYLELLNTFQKLLAKKAQTVRESRNRMATGLNKLQSATQDIKILKEDLANMQPQLIQASADTDEVMKKIEIEKVSAEKIRETISVEEKAASEKAQATQAIKDDAERDLAEALPALEMAVESLKCLTKNDVVEVRSMQRPPDGVKLVIEAVCIMKGIKPKKVENDKGKKVDDYWDGGKAIMADPTKFLESLVNFDKENIPDSVIQKIKPYIDNENFSTEAISRVSKAATSMCLWVRAMEKYYQVSRSVEPKRIRLHEAEAVLEVTMRGLNELKSKIREIEESIHDMEKRYEESVQTKKDLARKVEDCQVKLVRSGKLIEALADEKIRWAQSIEVYDKQLETVVADVLICSGAVAYLGPFTGEFRRRLIQLFSQQASKIGLKVDPKLSIVEVLGNALKIKEWEGFGLPKDTMSRENAIINSSSSRWPLFIDPQGQANKWIRNFEFSSGLEVLKLTAKDFLRNLENCIRFGKPCMLENVGESLDSALEPILLKQTFKQGNSFMIRLGDNIIPFHDDFRLYLTSKLPSPKFSPELMAKVTVINFTLAPAGLEDQLLGSVISYERPDLEAVKNEIVVSNAAMRAELKKLEEQVLFLLSSVQGSPVDDERLIDTLSASKKTSTEIQEKMKVAAVTEKEIDETRNKYIPVAKRARILFFCVSEMSNIDPMYQYSLDWFLNIFAVSLANSEKPTDVDLRLKAINEHFTFALYSNVCRSLFEKHKILFALLLSVRIQMEDGLIDEESWKFLVTKTATSGQLKPLPETLKWLPLKAWQDLQSLCALPFYAGLDTEMERLGSEFHEWNLKLAPERSSCPGVICTKLTEFQKLLLLKCVRPDRLMTSVQIYVAETLGAKFLEPQSGNLLAILNDSSVKTPILFVLSPGVDPAQSFFKLAEDMRFASRTGSISLGQGQGARAEVMLKEGMETGMWILLQNCHLCPSWMPTLEKLIDNIAPERVHADFRIWLTSMPTPKFPMSILQNSVKVTMEPPRGVKANLLRTYSAVNDAQLVDCSKPKEWAKLTYAVSLFHAVIIERKKFGALGWNIPYEFTDGDLDVCKRMLKDFLERQEKVPYKALLTTTAQVQYGGRITDDWDRRMIQNLLVDFLNPQVLEDGYKLTPAIEYISAPIGNAEHYVEIIKALPMEEPIELFNLDPNAKITHAQMEAETMFETILSLTPKGAGGESSTQEAKLMTTIENIFKDLPQNFDLLVIAKKHPASYENAMPTVLVQEAARYNRLLTVLKKTLGDCIKALKGLISMNENLEAITYSISVNMVPASWSSVGYLSLKPLSSWLVDLKARCAFLQQWIDNGEPAVYWMPGFFFPQAFLTGVLQTFARKHKIAIDMLGYTFEIVSGPTPQSPPADGCYLSGLYLEGARWDRQEGRLDVSIPHKLFDEVPVIWLKPKMKESRPSSGSYACPVYKTTSRSGTLSTTGHSTNYVLTIELKTDRDEAFWIKRGVAMFCSLSY